VTRRDLFKFLPALPLLPGLISKLGTASHWTDRLPFYRDHAGNLARGWGEPLANGAMRHTRETYSAVTRQLIERVTWVTKRGETLDGSTRWLK